VVLVDQEIKKIILDEAHMSKLSIHPDSTKIRSRISGGPI
jgi:hypothetical protein